MKFRELAAQVIDHELTHPTSGKTGIVFRLAGPQDNLVRDKMERFHKKPEDKNLLVDVIVAMIRGWDEVAMEQSFTPENVRETFLDVKNEWAVEDIMSVIRDRNNFFRKQD